MDSWSSVSTSFGFVASAGVKYDALCESRQQRLVEWQRWIAQLRHSCAAQQETFSEQQSAKHCVRKATIRCNFSVWYPLIWKQPLQKPQQMSKLSQRQFLSCVLFDWVAVISAKNHKRQRRKRQCVTAKREKSQTLKFLTAILTSPNLT